MTDGAIEYTWPVTITETNGEDISVKTIEMSLSGSHLTAGTWQAPDKDKPGLTTASRVVQLLIGAGHTNPGKGTWYLWWRITDAPEVAPRLSALAVQIV